MIRKSQVEKLLSAQREFDDRRDRKGPLSDEGRVRAASVLGAAYRNASAAERRAFSALLGPDGRAPRK